MERLLKGFSYAYNRNIGWQDRAVRTVVGLAAAVGAAVFMGQNLGLGIGLAVLAVAQFGTVLSARCIICYFAGRCTIDRKERQRLASKGVPFENPQG